MERARVGDGPVVVPAEVLEGLAAVRRSGVCNMLDRECVRQVAGLLGQDVAYRWLAENPGPYAEGVFRGFAAGGDDDGG